MVCLLVVIGTLLASVESATVLNFVIKQCDRSDTFLQLFGGSLQECAEECDRRPRCLSIMFMQRMNHCSLKDKVVNIANRQDSHGDQCMFLEKTEWLPSDLGPCNENKCSASETCVSPRQGPKIFSCLKSTCPSPPVIANAFLLSDNRKIGSTNRYHCKNNYRGFGIPLITCNNNAEWNISGRFWCKRRCSKPKSSYSNAVLSRIEYVGEIMSIQEILHFTCRKGYQALGDTVTSTCKKNGIWNYNRIRCCHNNTYSIAWHYRCSFYTGQIKSYGQFDEICLERGYTKSGFHTSLSRYILKNDLAPNMLMPDTKSYFETKHNDSLFKCFENENITMSNFTYDEKIQFARENNMTDGTCAQATWWAPSEPNGGTEENCIMRNTNVTGYLLYDIPCENLTNLNIGAFCHWDMPVI